MKQKEILDFNSQFETYADRTQGISLQEFVTIYNNIEDWNERMPSDTIELNVNDRTGTSTRIKEYLTENTDKTMEDLLTRLENPELYYFIFKSEDIKYNEKDGRIYQINMIMAKN